MSTYTAGQRVYIQGKWRGAVARPARIKSVGTDGKLVVQTERAILLIFLGEDCLDAPFRIVETVEAR